MKSFYQIDTYQGDGQFICYKMVKASNAQAAIIDFFGGVKRAAAWTQARARLCGQTWITLTSKTKPGKGAYYEVHRIIQR